MQSFETPPESVAIDDREYKVNTDFRVWMRISELMSDRSLTDEDKLTRSLVLCYGGIPKNVSEALRLMLWFYRGGNPGIKREKKETVGGRGNDVYSFSLDADYIYSAFYEQYGIDLTETPLHWWRFRAMFNGLNEDVLFSKIMGYRSMNTAKIKDKKLRNHYDALKKAYALPDMRTEEEKEADWGAAF